MKILECIPNISEGKDRDKIDAVAAVISSAEGVKLLDVCRDPDHHRTVFTFIGPPEKIEEAALAALGRALELIDMREHRGVHPRIGAVDVVPFVPLAGSDMEDAVEAAHSFGRRFAEPTASRCISTEKRPSDRSAVSCPRYAVAATSRSKRG